MKAKDQLRVETLRSVLSAFSYRKIEAGTELDDDEQLAVVRKLFKQRSDSIAEFTKAARPELAAKEQSERDILAAFLPAQMSAADVETSVRAIVDGLPADARNQSAIMKAAMGQLRGKADGTMIRQAVERLLKA